MRDQNLARDVFPEAANRHDAAVCRQRVRILFTAHFLNQELGVTHFELIFLMELLNQAGEERRRPVFQLENGPDRGLSIELRLQCQVHQHGDHGFQRLVKVIELVLNHGLEDP